MKVSIKTFTNIVGLAAAKPIHFFVAISLVFGILFMALIPPFQNPDEFTHFIRSYEVSELATAHRVHRGSVDYLGSNMPKSIQLTYNKTKLYRTPGIPDVPRAKKYAWNQTVSAAKIPLNKSTLAFYDTGSSPTYVPIIYLPQALAIKFLSLLNTPVLSMMYATRLVGLALWILGGVIGLRTMRPVKYRLALAGVMLLPMFVAQAATPSTDAILTACTVLFLAVGAKMIYEKEVLNSKRLLVLSSLLMVMVIAKPVYIAFGILLLALRTTQKGMRGFGLKLLAILIPFILYGLWSVLTKNTGGPLYVDAIAVSHASPGAQVGFLVPNIFNFVEPFVNTLLLGWGDGIYTSLIGTFGKLDTPLPIFFVAIGYAFALVAIFAGINQPEDSKYAKTFYSRKSVVFLTILTALVFMVGVYLGMYVYSTPPHEKIITGVQGRYLLPLLPLFVLLVGKHWVTMREKAYNLVMIATPVVLLVASGLVVVLRYYTRYP